MERFKKTDDLTFAPSKTAALKPQELIRGDIFNYKDGMPTGMKEEAIKKLTAKDRQSLKGYYERQRDNEMAKETAALAGLGNTALPQAQKLLSEQAEMFRANRLKAEAHLKILQDTAEGANTASGYSDVGKQKDTTHSGAQGRGRRTPGQRLYEGE
jgi:hypothetical protein